MGFAYAFPLLVRRGLATGCFRSEAWIGYGSLLRNSFRNSYRWFCSCAWRVGRVVECFPATVSGFLHLGVVAKHGQRGI